MKKRRRVRRSKKTRLSVQALERRELLAADVEFIQIGSDLYFEISADNGVNDSVQLATAPTGDVLYTHTDLATGDLLQSGEVEADDIALAELVSGADFAGFRIDTGNGDDVIDLSGLTNFPSVVLGGRGDDVITGGAQADLLEGSLGDDKIIGNDGDDTLVGGGGDDSLVGGAGDDSLNGQSGNDILDGSDGDDVVFGGSGNDRLAGGEGVDDLNGSKGNDIVLAEWLDKAIRGGTEFDQLRLQDGLATMGFEYDNADFEVVNTASVWTLDTMTGDLALAGYVANDDVVDSSGYRDTSNDTSAAMQGVTITTGAGDDEILGSSRGDTIYAGANDDIVEGGPGADLMDGGPGEDLLTYENANAAVDARLYNGTGYKGDAKGDTFKNFENLTGSEFDDTLYGDNSANIISGLGGNDVIKAYGGNDELFGGDGDDTLYGHSGRDTLFGELGNDKLIGGFNVDQVSGGAGDDTLEFEFDGAVTDASLFGGSGDDVFVATGLLTAADEFAIRTALGSDTISDFEANDDDELQLQIV